MYESCIQPGSGENRGTYEEYAQTLSSQELQHLEFGEVGRNQHKRMKEVARVRKPGHFGVKETK